MLPEEDEHWSLAWLRGKQIKIGAKIVRHELYRGYSPSLCMLVKAIELSRLCFHGRSCLASPGRVTGPRGSGDPRGRFSVWKRMRCRPFASALTGATTARPSCGRAWLPRSARPRPGAKASASRALVPGL